MSKAILRLEMPNCCNECPCFRYGIGQADTCAITEGVVSAHWNNGRPAWCRLEPVREPEVEIKIKNYSSG